MSASRLADREDRVGTVKITPEYRIYYTDHGIRATEFQKGRNGFPVESLEFFTKESGIKSVTVYKFCPNGYDSLPDYIDALFRIHPQLAGGDTVVFTSAGEEGPQGHELLLDIAAFRKEGRGRWSIGISRVRERDGQISQLSTLTSHQMKILTFHVKQLEESEKIEEEAERKRIEASGGIGREMLRYSQEMSQG